MQLPEKNLKQKKRQIQAATRSKHPTAARKLSTARKKRNGDSACEARLANQKKKKKTVPTFHTFFFLLPPGRECYYISLKSKG